MKIAVNTRLLIPNKLDGIGWFTYETLKQLTKNHPEHEFVFIFDRPYSKEFVFSNNVEAVVCGPQARHPILWFLWFEFSIPRILKKHNIDLFLSQDGYLSLRTDVPSISVIHDINFEHYPDQLPFLIRKYYRYFFPKYALKAKRLATVSEFSKADIAEKYHINSSSIDVVYNGVNTVYEPVKEESKALIKKEYTNGEDYFLFVGTLHPRKNITRMLKAFDAFKKEMPSKLKLLIVGRKMWWDKEMEQTYNSLLSKDDILILGRIDPVQKMGELMGGALALVYVPVFEGFGIPVVEAQAAEVPVITSNTSCLPEVAGDGALLCDPFSVESIRDAMKTIYESDDVRYKLIEKGKKNASKYTWAKTSDKLWCSIEEVIKMINRD